MTLLEATEITAGYGMRAVLHDVTLQLERGERLLLIGPNGSGKSTLLKTLAGVLHVETGNVFFRGEAINRQPTDQRMRMGMGYLRQTCNIFPSLNVEENLDISGNDHPCKTGNRLKRILRVFPDLTKKLKDRAGTLSGGQRQTLAIAMVLMRPVDLLLIDEPTAGLSPKAAAALLESIHSACEMDGFSYIMVEHNLTAIQPWISRVAAMKQGRITADVQDTSVLLDHEWLAGHYFQ